MARGGGKGSGLLLRQVRLVIGRDQYQWQCLELYEAGRRSQREEMEASSCTHAHTARGGSGSLGTAATPGLVPGTYLP